MHDREVCQVHGGKTPRGLASPHYKNGATTPWDKILPERLRGEYVECMTDPKLLSLRKEIALGEARERELLKLLDTGESGGIWTALRTIRGEFAEAQAAAGAAKREEQDLAAAGDKAGAAKAAGKLLKAQQEMAALLAQTWATVDHGANEFMLWRELFALQEHLRKMKETEWKSIGTAANVLSGQQIAQFFAAVRSAIITEIPEPKLQQAVIDRLRLIVREQRIIPGADGAE